jgi:hypothetical protein
MPHIEQKPLSIEREYTQEGNEIIVIEGVRYDADYFRAFAHPETDVLYQVMRDGEGVVKLTVIQTLDEARKFFEQTA